MSALFCWSVSIYYLFESIFCMRISIYYYVQYSALCVHYVQSIATTDNYLWVFSVWELYVQVKLAVCLRKDSGSPAEAHSHRFGFICIHFSSGKGRVVIGPDHSPHVDVEQWQVHVLCSNLALAVMGRVHILRVHIVIMINTAQRHCHSKCQCA